MPELRKTGWKKWIYALSVAGLAFIVLILVLAYIYTGDTIRKGIRIEQTDVSWLSAEDAKKQVESDLGKSFPSDRITLYNRNRKWELMLDDIEYSYSVEETVGKAFLIGREGNLFQKVFTAVRLLLDNQQFQLESDYDRDKLRTFLGKIKKECDATAQNAQIHYEKGIVRFSKETVGERVDIDINAELVDNHLKKRDFEPIELLVDVEKPHIMYDDIREISGAMSSFSTRFNPGDTNRSDNIRLACSRLSGTILLPGEEFSMNESLGPRTLENGYKEAKVIVKNELIDGTGGGVCQVSSTLYNSVLLAGLEVTDRTHHSMPLTYIDPGRDATINEDSIDFRFENSSDYPVCLQADVTGDKVVIRVLGKKQEDGNFIRLKTETLKVYNPEEDEVVPDDTLGTGEKVIEKKAIKGIRVALYKETYENGELRSREKLTEDYYKPVKGKVRLSRDLYDKYMAAKGAAVEPVPN